MYPLIKEYEEKRQLKSLTSLSLGNVLYNWKVHIVLLFKLIYTHAPSPPQEFMNLEEL